MNDRGRAVIFGRDALTYETARPTYPGAAIEHIRSLGRPTERSVATAVEIGAGTGKATVDMAGTDMEIVALEPSPQMARVLRDKRLKGVEVVESTFEEWSHGEAGSIDLIYAAQAWHWVDQDASYSIARDLLRPAASLALMWNIPIDRYELFESVYQRHAPTLLEERDRRIHKRDSVTWGDDMAAAGFDGVERVTLRWTDTLSSEQIRALYSTYSDHLMLPDGQRSSLLDGLAAAVTDMGGTIDIEYRTEVFSGRKI